MISCLALDKPGRWRWLVAAAIVATALLPACPLLAQALFTAGSTSLGGAFARSVLTSLSVAVLVAACGFACGLPAGVLAARYEFPGRRLMLATLLLPLLVPTFLWAIGWSALGARIGPLATWLVSGQTGCVLVFLAQAAPLVLVVSFAAASSLSGSQVDAARLAGGERAVLWYTCRYVAAPSALAAALAGVMTLSDPGPGQILGLRTVASDILTRA